VRASGNFSRWDVPAIGVQQAQDHASCENHGAAQPAHLSLIYFATGSGLTQFKPPDTTGVHIPSISRLMKELSCLVTVAHAKKLCAILSGHVQPGLPWRPRQTVAGVNEAWGGD